MMRAYASTASSLKDRARAITFIQASYVIGMTVGPGIPVGACEAVNSSLRRERSVSVEIKVRALISAAIPPAGGTGN